jgi:short-subunit dehydrogenase
MKLAGACTLLTGASGGIGRCLALELARRGSHVALLARDEQRLLSIAQEARGYGVEAHAFPLDLTNSAEHPRLIAAVEGALGGLDILINNAAISSFTSFADSSADSISRLLQVNIDVPLLLTRAALPRMLERGSGHVVNIGSILGSIAFPHFAVYSASKFALRGFSEALRRELSGTDVRVSYIAPRTTLTAMNTDDAMAFMRETGTAIDSPDLVAGAIADAIEADRADTFIGRPESIFVRLNALLPRLVDRALARQRRIAEKLLRVAAP